MLPIQVKFVINSQFQLDNETLNEIKNQSNENNIPTSGSYNFIADGKEYKVEYTIKLLNDKDITKSDQSADNITTILNYFDEFEDYFVHKIIILLNLICVFLFKKKLKNLLFKKSFLREWF